MFRSALRRQKILTARYENDRQQTTLSHELLEKLANILKLKESLEKEQDSLKVNSEIISLFKEPESTDSLEQQFYKKFSIK